MTDKSGNTCVKKTPYFDSLAISDVFIEKIGKKKYKIKFSSVDSITLYQIWNGSYKNFNSERLVYDTNTKRWVDLFLENTPIKPTVIMVKNSKKWAFVLKKVFYENCEMCWIVSTQEIINKSDTVKNKLITGCVNNVRLDIGALTTVKNPCRPKFDRPFFNQTLIGDVYIIQTDKKKYKIIFRTNDEITLYQIYSANNNQRIIYNSDAKNWVDIFNGNKPFEPTTIMGKDDCRWCFVIKDAKYKSGKMIWDVSTKQIKDLSETTGTKLKTGKSNKVRFDVDPLSTNEAIMTCYYTGDQDNIFAQYLDVNTNNSQIYQTASIPAEFLASGIAYIGNNEWLFCGLYNGLNAIFSVSTETGAVKQILTTTSNNFSGFTLCLLSISYNPNNPNNQIPLISVGSTNYVGSSSSYGYAYGGTLTDISLLTELNSFGGVNGDYFLSVVQTDDYACVLGTSNLYFYINTEIYWAMVSPPEFKNQTILNNSNYTNIAARNSDNTFLAIWQYTDPSNNLTYQYSNIITFSNITPIVLQVGPNAKTIIEPVVPASVLITSINNSGNDVPSSLSWTGTYWIYVTLTNLYTGNSGALMGNVVIYTSFSGSSWNSPQYLKNQNNGIISAFCGQPPTIYPWYNAGNYANSVATTPGITPGTFILNAAYNYISNINQWDTYSFSLDSNGNVSLGTLLGNSGSAEIYNPSCANVLLPIN